MVSFKLASLLLTLTTIDAKQTSIRGNAHLKVKDDAEDVEFWTRMMQVASMPETERPTRRPTTKPSSR
jgi:hypothetical protein